MDNHVKNPRRSSSLGGGGYRSEELNKIILPNTKSDRFIGILY